MARCESFDVLIVGAGPAGIAAACMAAESGRHVGVIDDNPAPGGQIWRGAVSPWLHRFEQSGCSLLRGTTVIAAPEPGHLLAEADGTVELQYGRLILATGARERFLPFPGWASPHVMGAGGLQAMVKGGMPIAGRSVVVTGSGPLLLAVAATLRTLGARVLLVAEQAPWGKLMRFGSAMLASPAKLGQALAFKARLMGVPYVAGCWPTAVEDRGGSIRVRLNDRRELDCDYLACGFFLVPNMELAGLLECRIVGGSVAVDRLQQTSAAGVYAAGEVTGIGGLEKSIVEGQIAGHAAADNNDAAERLFGQRAKAHRFAAALTQAFELRDELRRLPSDDTLVCRCEDVPFSRVRACGSMREAKLLARCGMGPCQGRVCGAACEFLLGWNDASPRPPVMPVAVGTLTR